jgi:hypothetical protein
VQLEFGVLAFQAQEQAAIRRARVIDAVAVGIQALLIATQVEQQIPVQAVSRQARDVEGESDADMAQSDLYDEFFNALSVLDRCDGQPQIAVDNLDVLRPAAETAGAFLECILQAQTLLVGEHLLRAQLANVDDRFGCQVERHHEFECRHRSHRKR